MQDNFFNMAATISIFLLANFIFMFALFYYRKNKINTSFASGNYLLKANLLQLCFIFAALYFSVFIFYNHAARDCEDLDEDAKCQCYALEVINQENIEQKMSWANNGLRLCPDSKFFSDFLEKHS